MLENTVWRQYHKENDYAEYLSKYTLIDVIDLIDDEKDTWDINGEDGPPILKLEMDAAT